MNQNGFENTKTKVFSVIDKSELIQADQSKENTEVQSENMKKLISVQNIKPICILWHPACSLHEIPRHPEKPGRVDSILATLHKYYNNKPQIFFEAPLVTDKQILLFHSPQHLDSFLQKHNRSVNLTNSKKSVQYSMIDSDTVIMPDTKEAVYRAAGSVIMAVDKIFQNEFRSAFCCVRPPGHHAERNKICGFCFMNNAAIGARYAQEKYGINRVAVLDFDVHHGNGTEEGFIPYDNLFYGSTHEKDNFPGTGKDPSPYVGDKAKHPLHRRIVNRYLNPRANRFDEGKSVREEFRVKWTEIIEEMILFKPEFIIFSAGFDAHDADPLAWCDLLEEDYQWATEIVLAACVRINPISSPRCISVLEGGYDLEALSSSALAHLQALEKGYPLTDDSFLDRSNIDILTPNPSNQNKDLNGLIKASNKLQASIDEATKTLENLGIK